MVGFGLPSPKHDIVMVLPFPTLRRPFCGFLVIVGGAVQGKNYIGVITFGEYMRKVTLFFTNIGGYICSTVYDVSYLIYLCNIGTIKCACISLCLHIFTNFTQSYTQ